MEKDIREFFKAERERLELTQKDVAATGAIEQSTISKIERDAPYEPSVSIFIRAIRGLGMTPAAFFAKFEQRARRTPTVIGENSARSVLHTTDELADTVPSSPQTKASHHGGRSLSASISEEDLRTFFRILQRALGGSVIDAIDKAQTGQRSASARAKGTRTRKGA